MSPLHKPPETPDYLLIAHDIECGLHSGYPVCCVAFFITEWMAMAQEEREKHPDRKDRKGPGYVRCPRCLAQRIVVPVKPCTCREQFQVGARHQYAKDSGEIVPVPGTNGMGWATPAILESLKQRRRKP